MHLLGAGLLNPAATIINIPQTGHSLRIGTPFANRKAHIVRQLVEHVWSRERVCEREGHAKIGCGPARPWGGNAARPPKPAFNRETDADPLSQAP
jgi:hypothetical protein